MGLFFQNTMNLLNHILFNTKPKMLNNDNLLYTYSRKAEIIDF